MLEASQFEKSRCVSGVALDLKSSAEEADFCLLVVEDERPCCCCEIISRCLFLQLGMSVPLPECPCLRREALATETESEGVIMLESTLPL